MNHETHKAGVLKLAYLCMRNLWGQQSSQTKGLKHGILVDAKIIHHFGKHLRVNVGLVLTSQNISD